MSFDRQFREGQVATQSTVPTSAISVTNGVPHHATSNAFKENGNIMGENSLAGIASNHEQVEHPSNASSVRLETSVRFSGVFIFENEDLIAAAAYWRSRQEHVEAEDFYKFSAAGRSNSFESEVSTQTSPSRSESFGSVESAVSTPTPTTSTKSETFAVARRKAPPPPPPRPKSTIFNSLPRLGLSGRPVPLPGMAGNPVEPLQRLETGPPIPPKVPTPTPESPTDSIYTAPINNQSLQRTPTLPPKIPNNPPRAASPPASPPSPPPAQIIAPLEDRIAPKSFSDRLTTSLNGLNLGRISPRPSQQTTKPPTIVQWASYGPTVTPPPPPPSRSTTRPGLSEAKPKSDQTQETGTALIDTKPIRGPNAASLMRELYGEQAATKLLGYKALTQAPSWQSKTSDIVSREAPPPRAAQTNLGLPITITPNTRGVDAEQPSLFSRPSRSILHNRSVSQGNVNPEVLELRRVMSEMRMHRIGSAKSMQIGSEYVIKFWTIMPSRSNSESMSQDHYKEVLFNFNKAGGKGLAEVSEGFSFMHVCIRLGRLDLAQELVAAGAWLKDVPQRTQTLMRNAIWYSDGKMVDFLIENGAEIEARGHHDSVSPLHHAVAAHNFDAVKSLIEARANVNVTVRKNRRDIAAVCRPDDPTRPERMLGILFLLLDAGSSVKKTADGGYTPALFCGASGIGSVLTLLKEKGADDDDLKKLKDFSLTAAIMYNDTEKLKELIDSGMDLNQRNIFRWRPYDLAQVQKKKRIEEMLAAAGAKPASSKKAAQRRAKENASKSEDSDSWSLLAMGDFSDKEMGET
ncbi:Ankyrin-2 [Dactylella cylindrospora]|nr:Ankyrin-2 [Dactylella cylindrospora]